MDEDPSRREHDLTWTYTDEDLSLCKTFIDVDLYGFEPIIDVDLYKGGHVKNGFILFWTYLDLDLH